MQTSYEIQIKSVWNFFNQISNIPRPSKKEEKIRLFLLDFANQHKLDTTTDIAGNVLIRKPATEDRISSPALILQTHMDMVCEKNSAVIHNFETDAIQTEIIGDWMQAKGTTLGADNGIGIAMQLAILADNTLSHPALECLFTTDEETGLYGASNMDKHLLTASTLINLDTEEEGEFCIGCAGGIDTLATIPLESEATPSDFFFFKVKISGLQGGHSGEDINKGRANAIKLLSEYIALLKIKTDIRIATINGGNLRNAIPREAEAILAVPYSDKELVRVEINHFIYEVETSYHATETQIKLELESVISQEKLIHKSLSNKLIDALQNCPHGVMEMNRNIPTLVETSTNLAAIHTLETHIFIETSQRSANEQKKREIASQVGTIFKDTGASIEKGKDYPGWEPNIQSNILRTCINSYKQLFGKEPVVKVIHAGLECGVIAQHYPQLDMISIGPTIINAHSPSERVQISSVEKCWKLLVHLLKTP